MEIIDDQAISYARHISLESYQQTNYHFHDFSIKVETVSNNGQIYTRYGIFNNKCIFIAISQSFENPPPDLLPENLAIKFNMLNNHILDTDNPNHFKIVETIAKNHHLQIEFYYGQYHNSNWYTTPYPSMTVGNGKQVIHILNKGCHFELIKPNPNFIPKVARSSIDEIIDQQNNGMKLKINQKEQEEMNLRVANLLEQEEFLTWLELEDQKQNAEMHNLRIAQELQQEEENYFLINKIIKEEEEVYLKEKEDELRRKEKEDELRRKEDENELRRKEDELRRIEFDELFAKSLANIN